jgi:hypothetical protein
MNTPRKFWLVLIGAVLAMGIIACSCGSILPTLKATPQPLLQPSPTLPLPTVPGMAGRWTDPDTSGTVTTIIAVGDGYAVESTYSNELVERCTDLDILHPRRELHHHGNSIPGWQQPVYNLDG